MDNYVRATVTRMRPRLVAVVSACSAAGGAIAVLVVAWAAGWLHGEKRTVVVQQGSPPVEITARARPLLANGFDPAAIFRGRSAGVVTIYSIYGSGGSAAQGSGFVVSHDGVILTNS